MAFIDAHRTKQSGGLRWGVEPICSALEVAPSTYYTARSRPPSARAVRDAELGDALVALWVKNYSVYGRRKLTKAARRSGLDAGRDQVARLMRAKGLRGATRAKKRFTTKADPAAVRAPDLVKRDFTATRSDATWVADFTYCSTWAGIVYVAFVVDVFSRRIVGWKAARTVHASLVVDALNMAAWTRRATSVDGVVCHSDAGSPVHLHRLHSTAWPRSAPRRPSGPSATATTTRWPRPPSGCSRPTCTETQPPLPPTAGRGEASTTSRSPPAPGCRGSTTTASTASSTTRRRPRSRPRTTVTTLSPTRHENPTHRASTEPRPVQSEAPGWLGMVASNAPS